MAFKVCNLRERILETTRGPSHMGRNPVPVPGPRIQDAIIHPLLTSPLSRLRVKLRRAKRERDYEDRIASSLHSSQ